VRLREWSGTDYYAELGVPPTATRDEIAAAYRARARVLHPDTAPADPAAEEQFHRVAIAYQILSGPMRAEYDRDRRRGQHVPRGSVQAASAAAARNAPAVPAPTGLMHLTRRGARGALIGGIALIVAGLLAATVGLMLQRRDADLRAHGVATTALVVADGSRRHLEFKTRSGRTVQAGVPDSKSGTAGVGDVVDIRYDPAHPTHVITAASTVARDITLWIVAAKLFIVGVVLVVIGSRRLARP
jgi:curved DNA-binding protein CbpA